MFQQRVAWERAESSHRHSAAVTVVHKGNPDVSPWALKVSLKRSVGLW